MAKFKGKKKNPMTCKEFVDSLAGFRDDELAPLDRIRVREHLTSCDKCSIYLRGYERTIELAKRSASDGDASPALPEDLVRSILHARRRS